MSSQNALIQITIFIVLGLIGGLLHTITKAENWADLKNFSSFKRAVIGGACGFIYHFLYSEQNFPNSIMTIVSGYMGTDFILSIVAKYQKGIEKKGV